MITLPFVAKKPLDIPPIVSIELIQITDQTNIPYAPKAKKIIEKVKKEKEKLVSEQAPPKKIKKEKPDSVPLPDEKIQLELKLVMSQAHLLAALPQERASSCLVALKESGDRNSTIIGEVVKTPQKGALLYLT